MEYQRLSLEGFIDEACFDEDSVGATYYCRLKIPLQRIDLSTSSSSVSKMYE